jgi:hypothetical protein
MKTITFISHYYKQRVNVRLSDEKAAKIDELILLYRDDSDRVAYGYEPQTFSRSQIKSLDHALLGIDYWDKVAEK